jgi:type I restriction enzyme R subunit
VVEGSSSSYLSAEDRARTRIDAMLKDAGWVVQDAGAVNLSAGLGVAVREFILRKAHGRADYLLFVDRKPVGRLKPNPTA